MSESQKYIYFVRHGETEGNVGNFAQTHTTPLTERGHQQAQVVGERLSHLALEALLASPMTRAQQTAEHIAIATALEIETLESAHERLYPAHLQGKQRSGPELQSYDEALTQNYSNPDWKIEDGETFSDIFVRAQATALALLEHPAQRIAVVSHGRFLKFLVAYLLFGDDLKPQIEWDLAGGLQMTNTGITLAVHDGERWYVRTINDMAHFAE